MTDFNDDFDAGEMADLADQERKARRETADRSHSREAAMPVFVIKARDDFAVAVVATYAEICVARGLHDQAQQVNLALDEIRAWRAAHPDECKLPDHDHVAAGLPGSGSEAEAQVPGSGGGAA